MPTWVRVRDPKTGATYTVSAARAEQLEARGVEILAGVPATDRLGRPLPAEMTDKAGKAGKPAPKNGSNR